MCHAKIAKNCHLGIITQHFSDHIFATKACIDNRKKIVKHQYLLHMSHNVVNFSPLTAEIYWRVWSTPANFNGFPVLPSLLQWRRSPEANQTLHYVWPSPGLVHYICYIRIFGCSCPWRNFARCKIHFSPKSCVLLYWPRYCTALERRVWAKFCCVVQGMELRNFCRGRHLYSAVRPSRLASAHILVFGRPFVKRFALCYRTVVCLSCLPVLSVCDVGVLWQNGLTGQDETWHSGRPRPWPHCVRRGPSFPPAKRHSSPQFSAHIRCGQMAE